MEGNLSGTVWRSKRKLGKGKGSGDCFACERVGRAASPLRTGCPFGRLQNSRFFSKEIGKAWRKRLSPVSLSVFSLVPDLLFDCSRVLEDAKIRTVFQSIHLGELREVTREPHGKGDASPAITGKLARPCSHATGQPFPFLNDTTQPKRTFLSVFILLNNLHTVWPLKTAKGK